MLSAVSGGVAFGAPGAGTPLAISAALTNPLLTSKSRKTGKPLLVVADEQIIGRGQHFSGVTEGIQVPLAPRTRGKEHGENP